MPNETKSRGILYVAFGEEFDKLTAASARYSRQFTNLPIHVLTNIRTYDPVWKQVPNVTFRRLPLQTPQNRRAKVSLVDFTPFEETLFMDSDAVVQRRGIELLFGCLETFEIACQFFGTIQSKADPEYETAFVEKTYDRLAVELKEEYPIQLYAEAALLFRKTEEACDVFALWRKYWELMGSGRDMPAFCFAVKHFRKRVRVFEANDVQFCTNKENENFFIQHKGFSGFERKFGLPAYKDWNPKL